MFARLINLAEPLSLVNYVVFIVLLYGFFDLHFDDLSIRALTVHLTDLDAYVEPELVLPLILNYCLFECSGTYPLIIFYNKFMLNLNIPSLEEFVPPPLCKPSKLLLLFLRDWKAPTLPEDKKTEAPPCFVAAKC